MSDSCFIQWLLRETDPKRMVDKSVAYVHAMFMATPKKFFDERKDQSEVKARLVQKYFFAWAKVVMPHAREGRIAYIDLYAGPGRYKDGAASTPLMVLEEAIRDEKLASMLVGYFNDQNEEISATLQSEIDNLPGIEKLKHRPIVLSRSVGADAEKFFSETRLVPSFTFFDPFGYVGLSLGLIKGVLKDWGCDCIFFFNYGRINAGITNDYVEPHINALFGERRANELRKALPGKVPQHREALILEHLSQALKELGGTYVLPFRFMSATQRRPSHYLVFVSKHVLGYTIMKQIMAAESSTEDQGVPSFSYAPAERDTPLLFSLSRPLDALESTLLKDFAGQEITFEKLVATHHIDRPYIEKNYREVLRNLEGKGSIQCSPAAKDRRKQKGQVTLSKSVLIRFPKR